MSMYVPFVYFVVNLNHSSFEVITAKHTKYAKKEALQMLLSGNRA